MNAVHLHLREVADWKSSGSTYFRGHAFELGTSTPSSIMYGLPATISAKDFVEAINRLNGFFAVVHKSVDEWFVAVDRVRSLPLFWAIYQGSVYLSDDAYWLQAQTGYYEMDDISRAEMLYSGKVTGGDTLFKGIQQVEAGQVLRISTAGTVSVEELDCYRYTHKLYTASLDELESEYQRVLERVFSRLMVRVGDRTVVVPLSGGFDSRLVVLTLRALGHKNIIAYSYGRPGNLEATMSEQIAKRLGIPWRFVPYDNEMWFQWIRSPEWKGYQDYADGLCSLQHVQDWLAVRELKKRELIPPDSVFVPGHTADVLAGSRSKSLPALYRGGQADEDMIVDGILSFHYALNDWSMHRDILYPQFRKKVLAILGPLSHFPDSSSALECWDVRERQAKFIVNSVRTYEYWGYDWWLPFWDTEYMEFWGKVPAEYRFQKRLHVHYVSSLYARMGGVNLSVASRNEKQGLISTFGKLARRTPFYAQLVEFYRRAVLRHTQYDSHPLAWYGILSRKAFMQSYTGREHINSFLARIRTGVLSID